MADRRTILRGLAALPALAAVPAEADGVALAKARHLDAMCRRRPVDPFASYHQEILDLQAAIDATPEDTEEEDPLWRRWKEIDDAALASRPVSLAGAIGALDYARRELHQFKVENRESPDPLDVLVLHLIDGALDVLRQRTGGRHG